MTNKFLIGLVIVLSLGLIAETAYLFKLNSDAKEDSKSSIRISSSRSNSDRFPSYSFYNDIWNDDFFSNKPFSFGSVWNHDQFGFKEIENLHKDIDKIIQQNFNRSFRQFKLPSDFYKPNLDIKDEGDEYVIKLDMPGFDKNEIKVELKNSFLIVSGERKKDIEEKDGKFFRSERNFGAFKRIIPVPGNLKPNEVIADYKNGVLTIKIPKETPTASEEEDKGVTIDIL